VTISEELLDDGFTIRNEGRTLMKNGLRILVLGYMAKRSWQHGSSHRAIAETKNLLWTADWLVRETAASGTYRQEIFLMNFFYSRKLAT
jgi:hypothetical protein